MSQDDKTLHTLLSIAAGLAIGCLLGHVAAHWLLSVLYP